jgi:hypothetical protein
MEVMTHHILTRIVNRRKIVNLKVWSEKSIGEMKDKYEVIVTEEHKKSGIFPLHNSVCILFSIKI